MSKQVRRIVFFDLDGTLHKQDLFGCYLRDTLRRQPLNLLLVIPLLPVILVAMLIKGRAARWPMSVLLWAVTAGHGEQQLQQREWEFCQRFRQQVVPFLGVRQRLDDYLAAGDADVWLITGSPQSLVETVYQDATFLPAVNLIATRIERRFGGRVLSLRCLGEEKVRQLESRLGQPLELFSGYSDSHHDNPLLAFCQHRWRITPAGEIQQLE